MPIEEVKEAALLAWLATKQAQGWVVQHWHVPALTVLYCSRTSVLSLGSIELAFAAPIQWTYCLHSTACMLH